MKRITSILLVFTVLLATFSVYYSVFAVDFYHTPAEFTITDSVTNNDVEAFTFTANDRVTGSSSPITNQMISGGGFEPIVYRTRLDATADADDTIYADPTSLSNYDILAQGFYDGGEALIYRPVDGELKLVRRSRVKSFNYSDKSNFFSNKVLSTDFAYVTWDSWQRNCTYYFAVAAIDAEGNSSALSDWIGVNKKASYASPSTVNPLNTFTDTLTLADGQATLQAPDILKSTNDTTNKCAKLSWSAVEEAAGYILYTSYFPPEEQKGCGVDLVPGGASIKTNDMVILRKNFYDWSREKYLSPRVYDASGGTSQKVLAPELYNNPENVNEGTEPVYGDDSEVNWRLLKHSATDTPANFKNHGSTYMHVNLGNEFNKIQFSIYNHAGPNGNNRKENDYYKILEYNHTYRVEFWAKSDSETQAVADVGFIGFYSKLGTQSFNLTKNWRKYVADFTIPAEENTSPWIGETVISFRGDKSVDIDSMQMYDTCAEPNSWFDRDIQAVKDSGFTYYRNHTFIKTFMETYSMDMLCNVSGAFNKSAAGCATLDSYLRVCKKAEVNPWFQIEMHMSPDEWLGWAEFMCAPYDPSVDTPESKPYAYKRYLSGQTKPWIDEFDKIMFEISNETWNSMFRPWNFSNTVDEKTGVTYTASQTYGLYQEFVLDIFRYCKYSKKLSQKMESVLGGWATNRHEVNAGLYSPSSNYITRAAYNGGWDEGTILTNDAEGYFYTSVYGIQKATADAKRFAKDALSYADSRPLGTYEGGPGYPLPSGHLTDEETAAHKRQNDVQKSLAGATSTLDCFLLNAAYYNYDIQNFFTFSRGQSYFTSHASIKDGGQEHLAFKALTLYNNFATGDFVQVNDESVPTLDIPLVGKRAAVDDAPMVAAYATKNGNKYNVFVLSRKVNNYPTEGDDGYTPVTLNLPFKYVNGVTVRKMTGDPKTTNIYAENIKIEKKELPISDVDYSLTLDETTGAEANGVGPCSIYLYSFDVAENQPATPIPAVTPVPTNTNAGNLLVNPGFEIREKGAQYVDARQKFMQGWLLDDMTYELDSYVAESNDASIHPVSGRKMLKIEPIGGKNNLDRVSQNVDCKNGREYKLSFYTTEGTKPVFRVHYSCVSSWGHSPNCGNADHSLQTYLTNDNVTKTDAGNGWTKIEGTFTCINDCGIKILFNSPDRAEIVYYDDVRLEDTHPETLPTIPPDSLVTKPPYVEGIEVYYPTEPPEFGPQKTMEPASPTPSVIIEPTSTPNLPATSASPNIPSPTQTQSLATTTPTQPSETAGVPTKKATRPRVGKPTVKIAKATKDGNIRLTFTKVAKANGYRIACSMVKSFKKKNTRLLFTKGTKYTLKKLKKGKTYHIRVQAYVKSKGKKIFGKYSKPKHVRLKK